MRRPDVDQMISELTSYQIAEWMAFLELEPRGDDRADLHAAQVSYWVLKALCGDSVKNMHLSDLLLDFRSRYKIDAPEDTAKVVQRITDAGLSSVSRGYITTYEGDAPPIKRIGKRGKPTKHKERLWRILRT